MKLESMDGERELTGRLPGRKGELSAGSSSRKAVPCTIQCNLIIYVVISVISRDDVFIGTEN